MTSIAALWTPARDDHRRILPISPAYLRTELIRLLRNRKSLMFSVIMPVALMISIGSGLGADGDHGVGHGTVRSLIMLSLVLYGAGMTAASAGMAVSVETSQGWMRTLNLTPLTSGEYVTTKAVAGMLAGALPVVAVTAVGLATGARAEVGPLLLGLGLAWLSALLMAVLGLVIGLLVPAEIVGQALGLTMTVLGFAGGLFMPLSGMALTVGRFTPMWGICELCRSALTGQLDTLAVGMNIVGWATVFAVSASVLYRRRTERV